MCVLFSFLSIKECMTTTLTIKYSELYLLYNVNLFV